MSDWYDDHLPLFYVLSKGIRYMELDIWEGNKDGELITYSGYFVNKPLLFSDVLILIL